MIHFVADPPDVPSEVTCAIYEYSDNMTCTWDAGKPTYIDTKYVVHVKRYVLLHYQTHILLQGGSSRDQDQPQT